MAVDAKEAYQLPAQEFKFEKNAQFRAIEDGNVVWGSKEELSTALFQKTSKREFKKIVKTQDNSYTFLPTNTKKVPVRVYLDSVDLKKNNPVGYEEVFDNLILTCNVQNKVAKAKKLKVRVGAAAIIAAASLALGAGLGAAYIQEEEAKEAYIHDYRQELEDKQIKEDARSWQVQSDIEQERSQNEIVDDILKNWEQENLENQASPHIKP